MFLFDNFFCTRDETRMHSITGNEDTQQKRNLMSVNSVATHSPPPCLYSITWEFTQERSPKVVLSARSPSLSQASYNDTWKFTQERSPTVVLSTAGPLPNLSTWIIIAHAGERPFSWSQYAKTFFFSGELKKYVAVHTKQQSSAVDILSVISNDSINL